MKEWLKRFIRRRGGFFIAPPGADWQLDIQRLSRTSPVRSVFDVGANIGQTTLSSAGMFPKAKIWAFEPIASTFAELKANVSHLSQASLHQIALGAQPGEIEVRLNPVSVFNSLSSAAQSKADGSKVQVVTIETLDSFCEAQGIEEIDVLKTDTEGYDLEVMRGAEKYLSSHRIKFVFSEVCFNAANKQNTLFFPVFDYLNSKNYKFLGLYETFPMHYGPESIAYCSALFVRRE